MVRKFLFILSFLIFFLFLFSFKTGSASAASCSSCAAKAGYTGTLTTFDQTTNQGIQQEEAAMTEDCPLDSSFVSKFGTAGTYPVVCIYKPSNYTQYMCSQPTTQTCTGTQTCDPIGGCIGSSTPAPSGCTIGGTAAQGQTCKSDTDCNGQGGACTNYHCEDDNGYLVPPGDPAPPYTCKYDTAPKVSPNSGQTPCLTCKSGCTQTDGSGTYCVTDCNSTTKDPAGPISTQYCNPENEACWHGKCQNYASEPQPPMPPCSQYNNADPKKATKCLSINTDLGISLPTDPGELINALLGVVLSAAGGIAIFLIMISGYRMMISQGNPDQIKDAREQLTAAILGLLFVIFSLVILQIIGVNILNLPGFSG